MSYRVVYLGERAKRVWLPGDMTLEAAKKTVRWFKRRGRDAWVVDESGKFVPIPGVKRQPGYLE